MHPIPQMKSVMTLLLGVGLVPLALAGSAEAKKIGDEPTVVEVDCNMGDSVQEAIDSAKPGEKLTIVVLGMCEEDVTIALDDLVLRGDDAIGGTISGEVLVEGAQRVRISDITITGPGSGVKPFGGAFVVIERADLSGNAGSGLDVQGAHVQIRDNTLQRNGNCGAEVANAGSISSSGGNVFGATTADDTNANCGVNVLFNAVYREFGPDTLAHNGDGFVLAIGPSSSVELNQATVEGTDVFAMILVTQTSALVSFSEDLAILGNVAATDNAAVTLAGATLTGTLNCANGAVGGTGPAIPCGGSNP